MLVMAYTNHEIDEPDDSIVPYERLICYFRYTDQNSGDTPLYRMEIIIPESIYDSGGNPTPESLIPSSLDTASIHFNDTTGIAEDAAFYKVDSNSIVIGLLSREGNAALVNSNIYNFTISSS